MMMNNGTGHMDHGMKMYFHASAHSMILFQNWMTHNWQQMLGSCFAVFFISMLYEGLKVGRELLQQRMAQAAMKSVMNEVYPVNNLKKDGTTETYGSTTSGTQLTQKTPSLYKWNRLKRAQRCFNASHFVQTLLHFIQVWLSMCLMLIFMTYNIWLCLSVTLGAAAGYFAFAWLRTATSVENEHCN